MAVEETGNLLVAQMKRAIELIESKDEIDAYYSKGIAELENKMLEIKRDSIRYSKELRKRTK